MYECQQNLLKSNDVRKVHDIFYQAGEKSKAKTRPSFYLVLASNNFLKVTKRDQMNYREARSMRLHKTKLKRVLLPKNGILFLILFRPSVNKKRVD